MFPDFESPLRPRPSHRNATGAPLFLSPFIANGSVAAAKKLARVSGGDLGHMAESYSGYITVGDPKCESNLFFWYFPATVSREKYSVRFFFCSCWGKKLAYFSSAAVATPRKQGK